MKSPSREAALTIWKAGVDAVRAEQLVADKVAITDRCLVVDSKTYSLQHVKKVCVVGAGKAAGYLATALEDAILPCDQFELGGWVNVPANCMIPTQAIHLHAARPMEVNEPRQEGVEGTTRILQMVSELDDQDLCICVLTGGGSALLPAPLPGITLENKITITRLLSERGATIQELNRIRTALSSVKGGGLARACRAKRLVTLIISDVIGDPLEMIASGPTVLSDSQTLESPLALLQRFATRDEIPANVWQRLGEAGKPIEPPSCSCTYHLLANNQLAVGAAAEKAKELGFGVETLLPEPAKTDVQSVAKQLARHVQGMAPQTCLVWGGEPVMRLVSTDRRGVGGRNQHLVLETFQQLPSQRIDAEFPDALCWLSGGTDGEDGPTDAAGALIDRDVAIRIRDQSMRPEDFLASNDSYTFFQATHGLIKTGPTHTNVCDLRVAVLL